MVDILNSNAVNSPPPAKFGQNSPENRALDENVIFSFISFPAKRTRKWQEHNASSIQVYFGRHSVVGNFPSVKAYFRRHPLTPKEGSDRNLFKVAIIEGYSQRWDREISWVFQRPTDESSCCWTWNQLSSGMFALSITLIALIAWKWYNHLDFLDCSKDPTFSKSATKNP